MSALLALFHRDGRPASAEDLAAPLAATVDRAVHGRRLRLLGPVAIAHQHLHAFAEDAHDEQPLVDPDGPLAVAFDGRLDNRRELLCDLDSPLEAEPPSDARLVLAAYRRWRSDCVSRLLGDFSFALWDGAGRQLLLGRDALGTRGLCYHLDDRLLLAATDTEALLAHPAVPVTIDEVKVALFLSSDWRDQERSFFAGIRHVPPGEALAVSPEGTRRWRHWHLALGRPGRRVDRIEAAGELRRRLERATSDRLRATGPAAVSLSGGMDSTTVAALAARQLAAGSAPARLRSYSYVFDELASCDERPWIGPVVALYDLEANLLPSDEAYTLRDPATWPSRRGFPDSDAFARLPESVRAAAARDGIRQLLVGHYGDALFLSGRLWLAAMLRDGRALEALAILWRRRAHVAWRRDLWEMGLRAALPPRWKRRVRGQWPRGLHDLAPSVSRGLARRTDLADRLGATIAVPEGANPAQAALYEDLLFGPRPQALAAARPDYERLGVDLADPLHDRRVVELVATLPADLLGLPGASKRVLRDATAGLLPPYVRRRPGKTDFTPLFRRGLYDRERRTVEHLLRRPRIVDLDYVNASWLERAVADAPRRPELEYPLWLCICLELWLLEVEGSTPTPPRG